MSHSLRSLFASTPLLNSFIRTSLLRREQAPEATAGEPARLTSAHQAWSSTLRGTAEQQLAARPQITASCMPR